MISLDASVRNDTAASTSTFRPRRGRPDGEVESRQYDLLGRLVATVNGDGTTTMVYDRNLGGIGQLAETTSPDNIVTSHHFDGFGRPVFELVTVPSLAAANQPGAPGRALSPFRPPDVSSFHPPPTGSADRSSSAGSSC